MTRLLTLASFRHLLRHPLQLLLAVLGISLGVAVVVAVDLANESARRSFLESSELVSGTATHTLIRAGATLPEDLYRGLRVELGLRRSAPIVEGYVAASLRPESSLRLIGVDPFAEFEFRDGDLANAVWSADLGTLMAQPGAVLISAGLAATLGVGIGDSIDVITGSGVRPVHVAGLIESENDTPQMDQFILSDISTAQELLGLIGQLSRIDFWIPADQETRWSERMSGQLPKGAELQAIGTRNQATLRLAGSFQLNLTAMSLLALVVGMFLIYNTMTFSVVQRRPLLGRLRALGVTRNQLMRVILLEALLLGVAGTALGLLTGIVLGHALLGLVSRTVGDLYYDLSVVEFSVPAVSILKAIALGTLATLAAAWIPAREAARAPAGAVLQRSDLEQRTRRMLPRLAFAGALTLLLATLVLLLSGRSLVLGFSGLFMLILGCALLTPATLTLMASPVQTASTRSFGFLGRMASRDITRHLSRTGVATAALMVAVATGIGVGVMVDSFRGSVAIWLGERLNADLYLTPVRFDGGTHDLTLEPAMLDRVRAVEGVRSVGSYRRLPLDLLEWPTQLIVLKPTPEIQTAYRFKAARAEDPWAAFESGTGLMVSEPLAYRHGLELNDLMNLPTPAGTLALPITGIFYDYGSEHGMVLIHESIYRRYWPDPAMTSLGIYGDTSDLAALTQRIETAVSDLQSVSITPSRAIREQSMAIFDRTFTITNVLRALAMLVAFVGVLSALMAMLLDRSREFAVLRAIGLTPRELGGLMSLETLYLGASAGLLAIPTGLMLAWVLIFVINRRAFGWTMQFQVDPSIVFQAVVLAVIAALLAGLYPAWRMARTPPSVVLRSE